MFEGWSERGRGEGDWAAGIAGRKGEGQGKEGEGFREGGAEGDVSAERGWERRR